MTRFIEVPTPKLLDVITGLEFTHHNQDQLLVTSFDSRVLLYDAARLRKDSENGRCDQVWESPTESVPLSLLSTDFGAYVGGLDGSVSKVDFENAKLDVFYNQLIGDSHLSGINNLCALNQEVLVASSFDGVFRVIDGRVGGTASSYSTTRKIFNMDSSSTYLTLALSGNVIEVYDHRQLSQPFEKREVGLNLQIKDLKCFPTDDGFAISTVDGRVSMEYFSSEDQSKRFTFKCHRYFDKELQVDQVYPVNALQFSKQDTLFTAGSDGALCLWDVTKRKRIRQYPKFLGGIEPKQPESVLQIGLNSENSLIAVATSDDNYKKVRRLSDNAHQRNASKVYLKFLEEDECRSRP